MSRMKIIFIPADVSGVMFYRVWQPAEAMRRAGHEVAVMWYKSDMFLSHPWEDDMDRPGYGQIRAHLEYGVKWADVVIWQKLHTKKSMDFFVEMRNKYEKPMLTETDDYIFSIPESNIASEAYAPGSFMTRYFADQMGLSTGMIVSTPYLKEQYKRFNNNIHVVENAIDLRLWGKTTASAMPQRPNSILRSGNSPNRVRLLSHAGRRLYIGWAGGGTHAEDLNIIEEPLFRVLDKYKHVHFKICAGETPHGYPKWVEGHPRIHKIYKAHTIKKYPKALNKMGFNIGIAPLIDNNFNRGKSNLRWLEYSALGIPCVASNVMHFSQTIKHGFTGFLAETSEDWVNCLSRLIESDVLRTTIGANANNTVRTDWNPDVMGSKYLHYLKEIVHAKPNTLDASDQDRRPNRRSKQHALVSS